MLKKNKNFITLLLIISLGLVLSACTKNTEEQKNDTSAEISMKAEGTEEQINENKEEIDNKEVNSVEDLDINKWREYENEYFDVYFKYHYNWYFHKTSNSGTEDYIAVYDFFPNLESLENDDYAIRLFILNEQDSFTENFSLVKEKQGEGKKYILVSNNQEYQEVLNLMFDNLEIIGDKESEEQKDKENSFNTYINEDLGLQFEYPEEWIVRGEKTEYNNRIYIENQVNRNYNISNYPEDFLGMWIDYKESSPETLSFLKRIEIYDKSTKAKRLLEVGSLDIYTYEFPYNPDSEASGVGPYLVAIWEKDSYIYEMRTMDSSYKDKNEMKVDILKQILPTLKFTN